VNDVNDEKVRRLLDDLAGEIRPDPGLRTPTLRRARRRRVVNATLAGALATTLVVSALVIAGTSLTTTPAPRPGTPPAGVPATDRLPSIWPEGNRPEVRAAQQRVDEGEDAWRMDPAETATRFAREVLGWDGSNRPLLVAESGATGATGAGTTPTGASDVLLEVGTGVAEPGDRISLRLRQLADHGEGGVWSVTEVRAAGIHLRSPVSGQRVGFGPEAPLVVSGTLASPQPVLRMQVFDGSPVGRPLEDFVTDVRPVERFDEQLPSDDSSPDGAVTLVVRSEAEDGTIVAATMLVLTVPREDHQPETTEQPSTSHAAPIEVESPVAGASVTSPVVVSGTADVFEATVSMEVRDELGHVVGSGFATATCGTGCRGDYQARLRFEVDHEQAGRIVVFQANPSDQGHRRLFPVTVPVKLFPSSPPPTAAIVVDEPIENARVASPALVSGTADVFEGTVSIRVLDENGAILSEDFTTATCGSGCLGTYRTRVRFRIDHKQRGSIQVFESGAENGEPLHMVEIPVTLLP
jgi:hypothetical protein